MGKNRKNRNENSLEVVIVLCITVSLMFHAITVINVLAYRDISKRTDSLSKRIAILTEKSASNAAGIPSVPESGKSSVHTMETAAQIIDLENIREIQETASQDEEQKFTGEEVPELDLGSILSNTADTGGQWALSVMDLRGGAVYNRNEEISMQSASVIKVFIMAAVYGRICYPAEGVAAIYAPEQYEGELKDLLTNMITVSDNDAANRLVELLGSGDFQAGKQVVNDFCQENGYTGTHLGRRFLEEDPQDDNYTTAEDCRNILRDIYQGSCVCPEASGKMLAFLQNQTMRSKIPSGLPEGIASANKTGEMPEGYGLGCIENDIAIVYGESRDYIICVLANDLSGKNEEARGRIREISRLVYEALK